MTEKPLTVTIRWSCLERIAEYYEFPSAVFLLGEDNWKEHPRTRNQELHLKSQEFKKKLDDLVEEYYG